MNVHIVSHTHWDREWYRNFNYFNIKLSYFFESLFEILDSNKNYKHFMLDGQMVMIEDYLLTRPDHKEKLKQYIKDHRVIIGPWYTQPDEFAPDGESLIRNLLIGINQAKTYGDYMKVGYLPDSFGHTAQLPQILKGFNIESACIMRGVPVHKLSMPLFQWKGLNDDQVLTVVLPKGYSNGMFLPKQIPLIDMRIQKIVEEMKEYSSNDNVLIMEGIDHQFPNSMIGDYIKSKESSDTRFIHSTLENYIREVPKDNIDELSNELIIPGTNRVHTSMASTRMTQKMANRKLEKLLEHHVEPYLSLSYLRGASYPKELVNNAWKLLLKNQTHDSICGCCTDDVHREIDQRFVDINSIGETLHKANARAIASSLANGKRTLTVFNDSLVKGKQIVNAVIYSENKDFILQDNQGNAVDYVTENVEQVDVAELSIWVLYMDTPCITYKTTISFEIDFTFNYGYRVLDIIEKKASLNNMAYEEVSSNSIENKNSKIEIHPNGSFTLYDKETKQTFKDLNIIEDCGDAGDTYNYSPVDHDKVTTNQKVSKGSIEIKKNSIYTKATISHEISVPKDLSDDGKSRSEETISLPVTTIIYLYKNIKRIDVSTTIDNKALNHRIRVLFPTNIKSDTSHAEIQFGVLERQNKIEDADKWKELGFKENPLPIYSMQKHVSIKDKNHMFSVLNKGLTEYEIYNHNTIAITLLRSVGYMGKENLSIRPGRPSGVPVATPDAQCLGVYTFEYSILVNQSSAKTSVIANEAIRYSVDSKAVQNQLPLTALEEKLGPMLDMFNIENLQSKIEDKLTKDQTSNELITLSSEELILSTIKKAEDENAIIIRLYNPSEYVVKDIKVVVSFDSNKIYECNFLEENINEIPINYRTITIDSVDKFTAKSYKIFVE